MKNTVLTLLVTVVVSCNSATTPLPQIIPIQLPTQMDCVADAEGSYPRFGYQISNLYEVRFHEAKDLDGNGVKDSIVILTPWNLSPAYESCPEGAELATSQTNPRVLLINLMEHGGRILQSYRYDSVLSLERSTRTKTGAEYLDVSSPPARGFTLFQDYGQGCYAKYFLHIQYQPTVRDFQLDSLVFASDCPGDAAPVRRSLYPLPSHPFPLHQYHRNFTAAFKREFGILVE